MIDYVGDVSRQDAFLLEREAIISERILEFGVGASTQIFATSGTGYLHSIDTSLEWIERTERRIKALTLHRVVQFTRYDMYPYADGPWDLIFVDGIDGERLPFAVKAWPILAPGGRMLFHDTRREAPHGTTRTTDQENVLRVVGMFYNEVWRVDCNADDTNITIVHKRRNGPLHEEDWNAIEKRTNKQRGYE